MYLYFLRVLNYSGICTPCLGPGEYRRYYDDPRQAKKPRRERSPTDDGASRKTEKKPKVNVNILYIYFAHGHSFILMYVTLSSVKKNSKSVGISG